jgi:hypothetical protein
MPVFYPVGLTGRGAETQLPVGFVLGVVSIKPDDSGSNPKTVDSGSDRQRQEGTRSRSTENIMPPQCRTIVLFVKKNLAGGIVI